MSIVTTKNLQSITKTSTKELIIDDIAAAMVCKLSNTSHNKVQEILRAYLMSETAKVLLFVANMAEVTLPMVNHLRVMIEEAENLHHNQLNPSALKIKRFVLLIHLPPSNFLYPCYPALYLRGWDHFYLDTIGHQMESCAVNIQDWFNHCCFPNDKDYILGTDNDSLLQITKSLNFWRKPLMIACSYDTCRTKMKFNVSWWCMCEIH